MSGRVLVVDDDQFILFALRALRDRIGYEIETASSSRQALDALHTTNAFDVVISDRDMPDMDGLEFLRRSRNHAPEMIRLMMSGSTRDDDIEHALRDGVLFRFIRKPCMPHQLAIHLDAAMKVRHLQPVAGC